MDNLQLKNEKVSVIVPIYNVGKFLDQLILSLIQQTYKNVEIFLVDDGSSDNSGLICDKFAMKDDRIRVIHKENGGVSSARNYGMMESTGEYIIFVDGDDWLELDCIGYLVSLIQETDSDMAFSDKNFTTKDRNQSSSDLHEIWSAEKTVAAFLYPGITIGCWNKIYKTKFLKKNQISFTMQKSGEGMHFIVSAAQKANRIGVGHRKVYNYRLDNTNSACTKPNLDIALYAQKSINSIADELIIKTPKVINAVNWHKWMNRRFIQYEIIATDSLRKNKNLFNECRIFMLKNLPSVLRKSEVNIKMKIKMILDAFFPILMAKYGLKKHNSCINIKENINDDKN